MGCCVSRCQIGRRPGSSSSSFYCVGVPNDSVPRICAPGPAPAHVEVGRIWANSQQSGDRPTQTRLTQLVQGGASGSPLQPGPSSHTIRALYSPLQVPRPVAHQRSTSSSSRSTSATSTSLKMASEMPSSQNPRALAGVSWNQLWA